MFDFFKKKSSEKNGSKTKLSESEIEQLKQELEQKKEEFRSLYTELIEAGGTELPDDILDAIAGGVPLVPSMNGNGYEKRYVEMPDGSLSLLPRLSATPYPTGGDR